MTEPTILLSALAAISIASAPPQLAVADLAGQIHVTQDSGDHWRTIHTCASQEPEALSAVEADGQPVLCDRPGPVVAMSWRGDALYGACDDGQLWRWHAPIPNARAVTSASHIRVRALGASDRELIAADAQMLWSVDGELPIPIAATLEPVEDIHVTANAVYVGGRAGAWAYERHHGAFRLLAAVPTCGLVGTQERGQRASLWLAGPDGLLRVEDGAAEVLSVTPATDLALWNDQLLVLDDAGVHRLPLSPAAGSERSVAEHAIAAHSQSVPAATASALDLRYRYRRALRRAQLARWLPTLSATVVLKRRGDRRELNGAIWLSWAQDLASLGGQ